MMILDTDHLSILTGKPSQRRSNLLKRLSMIDTTDIAITVISVEEQMRGWLSTLAKEWTSVRQIYPYDELIRFARNLQSFDILRF
jgi:tRNA(fMet)-specific endonuclease VapC